MARHKEIETKWRADQIKRDAFKSGIESHLVANLIKWKKVNAKGTDVFYSAGRSVFRHRHSGDLHEITVKGRLSLNSIRVRVEKNIRLHETVDPLDVHLMFMAAGCKVPLSIYKDCDIYFIQEGDAHVSIVWYRVKKTGVKGWKRFIEVEVEGVSQSRSLAILSKWEIVIENQFGLSSSDRSSLGLYEIYTGTKWRRTV